MNWKTILILAIVAAAAVYGVVWQNQQRALQQQAAEPVEAQLFPGLAEQVNDVDLIRLVKAGDATAVELKRGEQGWVVANKHDYPAALDSVRETLLALTNAKVIETKTANPERYKTLAVEDVSAEDATGTRIELDGLAQPLSVIVGKAGAGGADTRYVRRSDDQQSLLVSGSLVPATDVQSWFQQPIVELPSERIQRVVIRHPDGEILTLVKQNRDQINFEVFNMLAGRELSHDTVANPVGNALADLRLEDVTTSEAMDPDHETIKTEFYGFDGFKLTAQLFSVDDRHYLSLSSSFDEEQYEQFAAPEQAEPAADDSTGGEGKSEDPPAETEDSASETDEAATPDTIKAESESLNQRLASWVFVISQYKFDNMSKRLDDLLKPVEEKSPEETSTDQTTPVDLNSSTEATEQGNPPASPESTETN